MSKFIIRNDDIAFDTDINETKNFCEICDKHGYKIIQAITPIGAGGRFARATMDNETIKLLSFRRFEENQEVLEFLKNRGDSIAVHGLWHTHSPTPIEIEKAKNILHELGLSASFFAPPYNEGDYPDHIAGLKTIKLDQKKGERLEDFIKRGEPKSPLMYLHSWRFNNVLYTFDQLDACLERLNTKITKLSDLEPDKIRLWYNDWVFKNAIGRVLDIGKSRHWDYGFETLDSNPKVNPTHIGNIEKIDFPDETFDTVLCNGLYEFIGNPQAMIDEALRVTKKGGITIFGFVGPDYKPYKRDWKFYEGLETTPPHFKVDFGKEYHFLICQK